MHGRVVILGKDGQLGRALVSRLGDKALAFGRRDIDLADPAFIQKLQTAIGEMEIKAVINAAAYNDVDKAEGDGKEEAFRVNAEAVGDLAAWCVARNLPLVHYSTDYVFDGSGQAPRGEDAPTHPLNRYGKSKLAGEEMVVRAGGRHLIFRTSWVYDAYGKNFFNTILRHLAEKPVLKVVNDQIGAPTYAPHLAVASLSALEAALSLKEFPSGVYHLCNGGHTSRHGFAEMIFTLARSPDSGQKSVFKCEQIQPIPAAEYPLPAKRPSNSRLDCLKAKKVLGVDLPDWKAGVKECIAEKYGHSGLQNTRA